MLIRGGLRINGITKKGTIDKPLLTVITVVYNNFRNIENTILSIINQTYSNIEYIIIDGGSNDGTIDLIKKYEDFIDLWISEPDSGVYCAMNKAINIASGDWLNFMNGGDTFIADSTVESIFKTTYPKNISFLYSDFLISSNSTISTIKADYNKGIILHQSVIYRKNLHDIFGYYHVSKKMIVSDYLFFNLVPIEQIRKLDIKISMNSVAGLSNTSWCSLQKICFDYIFSRISFSKMIILFLKDQIK